MTAQLSLLPDLPRACKTRRVTEPVVRAAELSDGCRWWLKRAWGAGPLICWVMCNPSDADAGRDDPTMLRVMEFSAAWGFGSCVVVNIIPLISSTPAEAMAWFKRAHYWMVTDEDQTPEWQAWSGNIGVVLAQMAAAKAHVAAWGSIMDPFAQKMFLSDLAEAAEADLDQLELPPVEWLCLGTNANGSPRHPLSRGKSRVPDDFKPVRWQP